MNTRLNHDIAGKLEEVARLLAEQGANRFRIQAYHRAADLLRVLDRPVADIYAEKNLAGLEELPGIGPSIAHAIRDMLLHGQLGMLERLRGESDPVHLLISVPGVGPVLARRLHEELGIETLQELEMAAHDGRLAAMPGLGSKRLAGIRDSLAHRLGRVRKETVPPAVHEEIPVEELLDVDREYREKAAAGQLKKVAPRRFNPSGEAWLPVWHTQRGPRHYTALYSNTARAHQLGKSTDWVVLYYDEGDGERQCTVITSEFGALR
ncbi:MAG TPA: helix-hairpin-helix domain-containing protein, partial [Verrucomicrobiae bacterium]|nr:helix-hairpin-helix domain-containing protein [Verrucomicrobiae bacterium]